MLRIAALAALLMLAGCGSPTAPKVLTPRIHFVRWLNSWAPGRGDTLISLVRNDGGATAHGLRISVPATGENMWADDRTVAPGDSTTFRTQGYPDVKTWAYYNEGGNYIYEELQ